MASHEAFASSYHDLIRLMPDLDDAVGWQPTRCAGWTVRDLVFHLALDAQRALVALHSPVEQPPDVDAVSYWRDWQSGTPGADAGRRGVRSMASAWSSVRPIAELYDETARAVLVASNETAEDTVVATQGHTILVDDLLSTLAVEATVHRLDLRLGEPTAAGLVEVRHVLDGLLGRPAPLTDDTRYALVGTGRESLTASERDLLGSDADALPLFG